MPLYSWAPVGFPFEERYPGNGSPLRRRRPGVKLARQVARLSSMRFGSETSGGARRWGWGTSSIVRTAMPLRSISLAIVAVFPAMLALPSAAHPVIDLEAYCKQLVAFYDRYGAGRSENSDGRRHHERIGASIDCKDDSPEDGIETMTRLLERKRFEVPAPSNTVEVTSSGE